MTAPSKAKGSRAELKTVRELAAVGILARRVAAQGGMGAGAYDVDATVGGRDVRLEVKARAEGWREIHGWLGKADALVLRADRKPALICLPLDTFLALIPTEAAQ